MRGTLDNTLDVLPAQGIIPADAGNTYKDGKVNGEKQDHPRGCGEHLEILAIPTIQ